MKKYAYVDKDGIMHIVSNKKDAEDYSKNGKVIETDILASSGYPIVNGEKIIVYNETEMKKDATDKFFLDASRYPHLVELYKLCK